MHRKWHRLLALALALIWGPVTMCCALEAAGVELPCCGSTCEDETVSDLSCHVAEDGGYQSSTPTLNLAPAQIALLGWFHTVPAPETAEDLVSPIARTRPRDWVPTWQFERRAAAPAHAPDSLIG